MAARHYAQRLAPGITNPRDALPWTELGPGPIAQAGPYLSTQEKWTGRPPWAGRATAVATDPLNARAAYLGSSDGGVWKTIDDGAHWSHLTDQLDSLAIGALAIAGGTVLAGTGEPNGGGTYPGTGLYRSTDGGISWQAASFMSGSTHESVVGCSFTSIAVDPSVSSHVLAAFDLPSGNPGLGCSAPTGIYKSTDSGASFTLVSQGNFTAVVAGPAGSRIWYAGDRYTRPGLPPVAGVYESTDNGDSFAPLAAAPTNVGRMALAASSDGRLSALWATPTGALGGVATSTNQGLTFQPVPAPPASGMCAERDDPSGLTGQCKDGLSIAVASTNSQVLYVGGVRLFAYSSLSAAPTEIGSGPTGVHCDFRALVFDRSGRLWIGSDGGAYRYASSRFANLNATLAISQFEPGISGQANNVVGGLQDNGTAQSGGSNTLAWVGLDASDGAYTNMDPTNPQVVYYEFFNAIIRRTADDGATSVDITPYFGTARKAWQGDRTQFYAPFVMSPANRSELFVGTDRVWRSLTGGDSWFAISPHFASTITAIGSAATSDQVIFAATFDGGLEVTSDGGVHWTRVSTGLPTQNQVRFVTHITVDPTTSSTAYVTIGGFCGSGPTCAPNQGHLFRTTDGGGTWSDLSGDLPNAPTSSVALDRQGSTLSVYAATDVGVFEAQNGGASWVWLDGGLPNTVIVDLLVDHPGGVLIAATHGRGAFSLPLAATLTLSPDAGSSNPATQVTFAGYNFAGGETVNLLFDVSTLQSVTAGPSGVFSGTFLVPIAASNGTHTVRAVGTVSGRVASAPFLVGPIAWPQMNHDDGLTSYNATDTSIGPRNVAGLHAVWTTPVAQDARATTTQEPIVADGVALITSAPNPGFVGMFSYLDAYDASSGVRLWELSFTDGTSTPAIANGFAFVPVASFSATGPGGLFVIELATGREVAVAWTSGGLGPVTAGAGAVYATAADGHLLAWTADANLKPLWFASTPKFPFMPAVDATHVYVTTVHKVLAFNVGGCASSPCPAAWQFSAPAGGLFDSPAAAANGVVYVGGATSTAGALFARSAASGGALWTSAPTGSVDGVTITSSGIFATVSAYGISVVEFPVRCSAGCQPVWEGRLRGTLPTPNEIWWPLAAANGIVYVQQDHQLWAFNPADLTLCPGGDPKAGCQPAWQGPFPPAQEAQSPAAIADGMVFFADSNLYAYGV